MTTGATISLRNQEPLAEVVHRAAGGDSRAMGLLLTRLAPGMIRAAEQMLGKGHADLDDVVQQSLIGFVQALPAFRGECTIAHFASRIVARTALASRRRSMARADRTEELELDELEAAPPPSTDAVDAERRRALMRELFASIPDEQAETLALRVVLGFSLEEVAQATGVPMNTVRSRVRLAKAALKRRIEGDPHLAEALEVLS